MSERISWTKDMLNELLRLYRQNMTVLEIAEHMGIEFEKVKSAIRRAKQGAFGKEIQQEFLDFARRGQKALDSDLAKAAELGVKYKQYMAEKEQGQPEADVPEEEPNPAEGIVSEVEPEIEPEPVEKPEIISEAVCTPFREDGHIDMIKAIDVLIACARMFCMDELVEVRGSNYHERAGVIFTAGGHTYTLSLAFNGEE